MVTLGSCLVVYVTVTGGAVMASYMKVVMRLSGRRYVLALNSIYRYRFVERVRRRTVVTCGPLVGPLLLLCWKLSLATLAFPLG